MTPLTTPLSPLLQAFFTDRLARQRDASPHTIAAYRDSFRLLLGFVHERTGTPPFKLQLQDLDATTIAAFLSYLETERGNSVRTRNARLTAVHSFFHYAALKAPECSELIARVLAIPEKRFDTTVISYLTKPEIDALLAAPDRSTWTGRRDHALLLLAVQTGLRASELASLRRQDLQLDGSAWVRCEAKAGRRGAPHSPVRPESAARLAPRTRRRPRQSAVPQPQRPAPHPRRDLAAGDQARRHRQRALPVTRERRTSRRTRCVTQRRCDCSAHRSRSTPRRSRSGSDTRSLDTTNKYLHADMDLKRRALDRTAPTNSKPGRYQPPDALLAFLESL